MKVLDDPNWTYEWFGMTGRSLGGLETFGIRRVNQDEVGFSQVVDGRKVMLSRQGVVVP